MKHNTGLKWINFLHGNIRRLYYQTPANLALKFKEIYT